MVESVTRSRSVMPSSPGAIVWWRLRRNRPAWIAWCVLVVLYGMALIPVTLLPVAMRMAGPGYLLAAVALGLAFLGFGIHCAVRKRRADARRLFLASIVYLPALLAAMMLDKQAWGA